MIVALGAAIAAGAFGCEAILGMDGHDAHLAEVAAAGDAGGAEASPPGDSGATAPPCMLPTSGDARLRIGNLVPSTARIDACLSRSGGA